jgi:hypothetical protein
MINAEVVQRPELRFCKPAVAGSNPALGSSPLLDTIWAYNRATWSNTDAPNSQYDEMLFCKQRVSGSNPLVG